MIAVVAHELQHALEMLSTAARRDSQSGERLFRRIQARQGLGTSNRILETRTAQDIQAKVVEELKATP